MNDAHTLIIPTYNRPEFLRRAARYYHARNRDMRLLVLDSSRPQIVAQNAAALAPYGAWARHEVSSEADANSKIARGLALVQTTYASFCGDDDLVLKDPLREAIGFLDRHPDYVCAHGLYLNFRPDGNDLHLASEYAGPSIDAEHPGARIFRLLQKYESLFYAVFRTADLRELIGQSHLLPSSLYQELFQSVAALIKGKVLRFPRLYAARQSGPPADPQRQKWQTYYWFADNPGEVLEAYAPYREKLWTYYVSHAAAPRLEQNEFFRVLDLSHAVYFAAGCPPEYFHSALQAYWPADRYRDVQGVDLLAAQSSPRFLAKPDLGRLARLAGYAVGWVWSAPFLAALNLGAAPWRYRLPVSQRWLATVPGFRSACAEIRDLLGQP